MVLLLFNMNFITKFISEFFNHSRKSDNDSITSLGAHNIEAERLFGLIDDNYIERKLNKDQAVEILKRKEEMSMSDEVEDVPIGRVIRNSNDDQVNKLAICKQYNLEIKEPGDYTTFVDIDSEEQYILFQNRLEMLNKQFPNTRVLFTVSKSNHLHFYITFEHKLVDTEKVAWSSFLGSDPGYVIQILRRISLKISNPMCFFERKKTSIFSYDDEHFDSKKIIENLFGNTGGRKINLE